jgi:hypothetical protein
MYELLDHYLGLPRTDWIARFRAVKQQRVSEGLKLLKEQTARPAAVGPSLPVCRISHLGTGRFPELGTTLKGSPAEP